MLTPRQIIIYIRSLDPASPTTPSLTVPYILRATNPVRIQSPAATAYEYYNPQNRATTATILLEIRGG